MYTYSFFYYSAVNLDLDSFPTRRSSDLVIVGTIDHSRISGIKGAFLIGVNDGVWTLSPKAEGLINEQERALRSEEHTSELQSRGHLVCRLLLEKKNRKVY